MHKLGARKVGRVAGAGRDQDHANECGCDRLGIGDRVAPGAFEDGIEGRLVTRPRGLQIRRRAEPHLAHDPRVVDAVRGGLDEQPLPGRERLRRLDVPIVGEEEGHGPLVRPERITELLDVRRRHRLGRPPQQDIARVAADVAPEASMSESGAAVSDRPCHLCSRPRSAPRAGSRLPLGARPVHDPHPRSITDTVPESRLVM